jgi:CMP-N,N'-diacetyllegionaminic acid synthase
MTAIAIVPARGGSKGLPNKHILPLPVGSDTLLIDHTLEAVQESELLSWGLLTTDSPVIRERASGFPKVHGFVRAPELAGDEVSTEAVMAEAIDFLLEHNASLDTIVLLQPTSPLRTGRHIDEALTILEEARADSVVAVVPSHGFFWRDSVPLYDPAQRPRRQDMGGCYEECGAIYATSLSAWRKTGLRFSGDTALYVMKEEHRIQVDTVLDFRLVQALLG